MNPIPCPIVRPTADDWKQNKDASIDLVIINRDHDFGWEVTGPDSHGYVGRRYFSAVGRSMDEALQAAQAWRTFLHAQGSSWFM